MNEEQRESLFDLLTKKAVHGVDTGDQELLESFDQRVVTAEFESFEAAAAAVNVAGISEEEPLPGHLRARILEAAAAHLASSEVQAAEPWPQSATSIFEGVAEPEEERAPRNWFGWLGWAVATAAVVALAVNLWVTPSESIPQQVNIPTPAETRRALTPADQRDEFIRSAPDMITASWAGGNVKDAKQVTGDVVWSDAKQAGYVRFRGLPVRTAPDHCYQLWIYDKVQDKATPIDGGIFDVNTEGEVIIPINTKVKAEGPYRFALTIERHGGVVVSKGEQIAALANVETRAS